VCLSIYGSPAKQSKMYTIKKEEATEITRATVYLFCVSYGSRGECRAGRRP
jgi:hypothetical protein